MRTNIDIDDRLMAEAIAASGAPTKKAAVEMGLRELIRRNALTELKNLRGKINWIGDLDTMRLD
jgi:Arc/MetJ family transcription regulator